jgi:hypothetical protein
MKDSLAKYSILCDLIAMAMILGVGIVGYNIGYVHGKRSVVPTEVVETDTIRTTDTIKLPAPPPDTVTKTITKIVQVPLTDVEVDTNVDSARITLPFEQHHAQLGDVADVWYSGYQAKIDSAVVYKHKQTVIERHYITKPAPSNIIGIEAGTMYASVMYMRQLGAFYVGISAGSTYEGQATASGIVGIRF